MKGWRNPAFIVVTVVTIFLACVWGISAEAPWWNPLGAIGIAGVVCSAGLALGLGLARKLLDLAGATAVIARMSLDEFARRHIVWGSALFLWGVVSGLPFLLGEQRCDYRLQGYLSYSIGFSGLLLSLLTLFLGCASIANEVEDRRVYTSLVKPIARWKFVVGKVLALAILDLLLLVTVGLSVGGMSYLQLAKSERDLELAQEGAAHVGEHDNQGASGATQEGVGTSRFGNSAPLTRRGAALALERARNDVLVGRGSQRPQPPAGYIEQRVREARQRLREQGIERTEAEVLANERKAWRFVQPGESRTFLFDLGEAGVDGSASGLQRVHARIHLRPRAPFFAPQEAFPLGVSFPQGNSTSSRQIWVQSRQDVFIAVKPEHVDAEGNLQLVLTNLSPADGPSLAFSSQQGVELVFNATSFIGNLARGLLILWGKLLFLAALGVFASTFMGFPVACLFALILALCAAASDHIGSTDQSHRRDARGFTKVLEDAGIAIAETLQPFTRTPVTERLVSGRVFSWREVVATFGWISLGWGGTTLLAATVIFRRRELARVQV